MEEDEKEEEAKDDEKEHIPNRTLRYYTDYRSYKSVFWVKNKQNMDRKKSLATSRSRSLVPCNAAGGILEYTDYVKVKDNKSQDFDSSSKLEWKYQKNSDS